MTVNRVCGSGAHAIVSAAQEIMLGFVNSAVAGGMEHMDRAPYLMSSGRWGYRMGDGQSLRCNADGRQRRVLRSALWMAYRGSGEFAPDHA
jgi:acetyl-CoA acetyltransferase